MAWLDHVSESRWTLRLRRDSFHNPPVEFRNMSRARFLPPIGFYIVRFRGRAVGREVRFPWWKSRELCAGWIDFSQGGEIGEKEYR